MRIVWGDGEKSGAKRAREFAEGACARLSQQRLQLRPSVLDRIEVGRVARKEDEARTSGLHQIAYACGLVGTELVENDDVAGLQLGSEALLDVGVEGASVHRPVEHHRRDDAFERQRCRHRDVVAPVLRNRVACTLADGRARIRASHREVDPRFVDEEQSCGTTDDPSTNEALALTLDLWAVRFGRVETLFLRDMPISMSRRDTVEMLARTFIRFAISTTNSSNVASGCSNTKRQSCSSWSSLRSRSLPGGDPGIRCPSASRRSRILRTQLSLTPPRRSATSTLVAPSSKRATARSRKSNEYGWNMNDAINTSTRGQKAPSVTSYGEPL